MGQRLLSVVAEAGEHCAVTTKLQQKELHLLKLGLGVGTLYAVQLSDEDQFPLSLVGGWQQQYTYPTVVGNDGTDHTLTRRETSEEFLYALPDRLDQVTTTTVVNNIVWSSASPFVYNDIDRPERLLISVQNSTYYKQNTGDKDLDFAGYTIIKITGTDENDIEIYEVVKVRDDGWFLTRNIFKSISKVRYNGFDGDVEIRWVASNANEFVAPYHTYVSDIIEGPLYLELTSVVVGLVTYAQVVFKTYSVLDGAAYRVTLNTTPESVEEELCRIVLTDSSGSAYTPIDMAINHNTAKLYVLDSSGYIHVYEIALPLFTPPTTTASKQSYVEIDPSNHYAEYGQTEKLWTRFTRTRWPVEQVTIKRIAPDSTTEYLQQDKSWSTVQYDFTGDYDKAAALSWTDLEFTTTYNQTGEWEFVITTRTTRDTTTYVTRVMAGVVSAEVSLDTGVGSPAGLVFSKEDWWGVYNGSTVTYLREIVDGWYADTTTNRILLRENYDSVEVTY
jgi:hypothetical protein